MAWKHLLLSHSHKRNQHDRYFRQYCTYSNLEKKNLSGKLGADISHTIHRQKQKLCPGYHHVLPYVSLLT